MMRQIRLPYGHESRTIAVPEENLAWVEGPKHAPPVADLARGCQIGHTKSDWLAIAQ